jgi:hypothetical protein
MEEIKVTFVEASVIKLEPNDIIAIKIEGRPADNLLAALDAQLKLTFPNNKCVLFCNDIQYDIIRNIVNVN